MRIEASMIGMSSKREYASYSLKEQTSVVTNKEEAAAIFDLAMGSSDYAKDLNAYNKEQMEKQKEQQEKNLADLMSNIRNNNIASVDRNRFKEATDLELELLKKIINALNKYFNKNKRPEKVSNNARDFLDIFDNKCADINSKNTMGTPLNTNSMGINTMVRTTATSVFMTETENTTYNSIGMVKTSDGREITFGVSVEMSRAFCAKYNSLVQEEVILTDPLVINMEGNVGNISDKKFLFDLNCDGNKEEISFTGNGSGFLALDKNKDGKINDGNELFGTKSGNGFKDLEKYDDDGNGWIDENDDIFDELRIWTKDDDGNDRLVKLLESDVGAIYLGYADTEFTLNNIETGEVNGVVRGTGVFLKESGGVGTVQHVDLAL